MFPPTLFQVVDDLDPEEYGQFLKDRLLVVEEQKAELQAKREAKLLRTAVAEAKASAA